MTDASPTEIRASLRQVAKDAGAFFSDAAAALNESLFCITSDYQEPDHYWGRLPESLRQRAQELLGRLLAPCAALAEAARSSPLTGNEDVLDVKVATKTMRAAIRLRKYRYREAGVIHDEGTVLGFQPADQSEPWGLSPDEASATFQDHLANLGDVLELLEAAPAGAPGAPANPATDPAAKYRAGTAFIMMWMDPQSPELTDIADTVRSVFRSFGVRAVRADDIEHEGLITERILNEIRTSEFLFADLTGTRPNVYYEVGFAHALGKRVILFRKAGTGVHFDLSGYNCPEYENLRDLRDKFTKRLVSLTNRNPSNSGAI